MYFFFTPNWISTVRHFFSLARIFMTPYFESMQWSICLLAQVSSQCQFRILLPDAKTTPVSIYHKNSFVYPLIHSFNKSLLITYSVSAMPDAHPYIFSSSPACRFCFSRFARLLCKEHWWKKPRILLIVFTHQPLFINSDTVISVFKMRICFNTINILRNNLNITQISCLLMKDFIQEKH